MGASGRGTRGGKTSGARATQRAEVRGGKNSYPGWIRIIGGRWRGRRLAVPAAAGLRPTPDRVRETVFNWLTPALGGARCLDLFAGTGALCLEALSRGAAEAVMVESSAQAVESLRAAVARLGAHARVVQQDAHSYLEDWARSAERPVPFELVFVDPPFTSGLIESCVKGVVARGLIRDEGYIYIEAPARLKEPPLPAGWRLWRSKRAGEVGYHVARKQS